MYMYCVTQVTQEYASEALAEMLSFPADQAFAKPTPIQVCIPYGG